MTAYVSIYTLVLMAADRWGLYRQILGGLAALNVVHLYLGKSSNSVKITRMGMMMMMIMSDCDRFLAVVYPVSSMTVRTISNANMSIVFTWVVTTLTASPLWIAHDLRPINNSKIIHIFIFSRELN